LFHSADKWRGNKTLIVKEDEVRGMYVHLGIEISNFNGHGEEIDTDVGMMKLIKNLQKYVQIHWADNERLKRAKEK
jgi:hypothetical protein